MAIYHITDRSDQSKHRHTSQPSQPQLLHRRLVRRVRLRRVKRSLPHNPRQRRRRQHPHPSLLLRCLRPQDDPRPRLSPPDHDLAVTTGVAGPIASNLDDLALAYRVMAAPDPGHKHSSMFPDPTIPRPLPSPPAPKSSASTPPGSPAAIPPSEPSTTRP